MSEQPIENARDAYRQGNASLFAQRLTSLVQTVPNISPDAAVAAVAGNVDQDPEAVGQIVQTDFSEQAQAFLQQLVETAQSQRGPVNVDQSVYDRLDQLAQTEEQRQQLHAAADALGQDNRSLLDRMKSVTPLIGDGPNNLLGAAIGEKANEFADTNAVGGVVRTMSSTGFQALEAPFQVEANVANYALSKASGQDTGDITPVDMLTNTDIARSTNYAFTGNELYNPGQDWFGVAPDSASAITKKREDAKIAGGAAYLAAGMSAEDLDTTLGQRAAGSVGFAKGSVPYSIISGALDAGTRIVDPSMYGGGGTVKALLRGGRGVTEAAATARVGARVAAARETREYLDSALATVDQHSAEYAGYSARRRDLDERLIGAQDSASVLTSQQEAARAAAAVADNEYMTAAARQAQVQAETPLEVLRRQKLDLESKNIKAKAERRSEMSKAARAHDRAKVAYADAVARGETKPLPDGYTIEPAQTVTIKPTARAARETDPEGLPIYEHVADGTEESGTFHRVQIHDSEGNVAGVMFWNPESGIIEHIAVDAAHRRQGLATQLYHAAQDAAEEKGWVAPEHATRAEDLSESGAPFSRSHPVRPKDVEAARAAEAEAAAHREFVRGLYGNERDALTAETQTLAERTRAALGTDVDKARAARKGAQERSAKVDRKAAEKAQREIEAIEREIERTDKFIADALENRARAQETALAAAKIAAEKAGLKAPDTFSDMHQLFKDFAGMRVGFSGEEIAHVDDMVKFLNQKDAEPLLQGFAAVDKAPLIMDLTRGQIPAHVAVKMADEGTVEGMRAIIAEAVYRGEIDHTIGNLRGLRTAARAALKGHDPNALVGAYGKATGQKIARARYLRGLAQRNVPWAASRHIDDVDGMTTLVGDMASFAMRMHRPDRAMRADLNEIRDTWMDRMARTTTGMERRETWNRFLDDMAERTARDELGITDEDLLKTLLTKLRTSKASAMGETNYTAELRAANGGKPVTINGQELDSAIASLEAELSDQVFAPDWIQYRRALKSAKEAIRVAEGAPTGTGRAVWDSVVEGIFDKYWRTSVLAFRMSYIARNLGDIQVRMFLNGSPSMFTSPQGIAAMVVSHKWGGANNKLAQMIRNAERADRDVTGELFEKLPGEDIDNLEVVSGFQSQAAKNGSHIDPGTPDARAEFERLGYKAVDSADSQFHAGWANELGMLHYGPLSRDVLGVITKNPSKGIVNWSRKTGIVDRREAAVDYFWNGPGRKHLDSLLGSSTFLNRTITDATALRAYMFGDEVASLESRWTRLTDGLRADIIGAARQQIDPALLKKYRNGGELTRSEEKRIFSERAGLTHQLRQLAPAKTIAERRLAGSWKVEQVRVPNTVSPVGNRGQFGQRVQGWTNGFFRFSGGWENASGYLPEFRYAKWDRAGDMIEALSPEDAAKVLKVARETLGGGLPGSWAAKTLRKVEKGAARARGNGDFTVADLQRVTDAQAARHIEKLFYNAAERNAVSHAMRLISPFAQAYVNSMRVWGRLAFEKSNRVYAATRAYQAGQGKGTAWLMDDPTNPDDALFYSDPQSGQMMMGIPVAGPVLGALANATAAARGRSGVPGVGDVTQVATPLQGANILWQNSLLPGLGLAITIPANALSGTTAYQKMPDFLKNWAVPYTNADPDRDPTILEQLTPAWAASIMSGLGVEGFGDRTTKYIRPAMGSLFSKNPGRYMNAQGFMDADGQARLLQDAEALAGGLTLWRGVMQSVSPSTPLPEMLAKDKNGNTLAGPVLTTEFFDLVDSTGSREAAMAELVEKYGIEPVMTLLPQREYGYTPTNDAYRFAIDNPDDADKYGRTISLFYPGGGYSAQFARWLNLRGTDPNLDPDEIVTNSNALLREAQLGRLDERFTNGEISEDVYDSESDRISAAYKTVPQSRISTNTGDVARAEVQRALSNPTLSQTEAGHAASIYFYLREQAIANADGGNLGGAGDAPLRAWLRQKGEQLVSDFPEFKVMWSKVFRSEVNE